MPSCSQQVELVLGVDQQPAHPAEPDEHELHSHARPVPALALEGDDEASAGRA